MEGWLSPIIGLVGVIFGVGATLFAQWLDRRGRYHSIIFQKRLEVHQEAYSWQKPLYQAIESKDVEKIDEVIDQALQWYYSNCLYLDENSQDRFYALIIIARHYCRGLRSKVDKTEIEKRLNKFTQAFNEAFIAIAKGVGAKYLPDMYKSQDK